MIVPWVQVTQCYEHSLVETHQNNHTTYIVTEGENSPIKEPNIGPIVLPNGPTNRAISFDNAPLMRVNMLVCPCYELFHGHRVILIV